MSVDRPLHCQPVGIVNDICQTAYNLGGAENHQNALPKDYTDQSIRWAEIFRDKETLFRPINIFSKFQNNRDIFPNCQRRVINFSIA